MNLPPTSPPGPPPVAGNEVSPRPRRHMSGGRRDVAIARPNVAIERRAHTMRAIAAP